MGHRGGCGGTSWEPMRERQVHVPASTGLLRVRDIPGVETRGGHLNAESPQNQSVWSECVPLICSHSSHRPVGGRVADQPGNSASTSPLGERLPKSQERQMVAEEGAGSESPFPGGPTAFQPEQHQRAPSRAPHPSRGGSGSEDEPDSRDRQATGTLGNQQQPGGSARFFP